MRETVDTVYWIAISTLKKSLNPFTQGVWNERKLTRRQIKAALDKANYEIRPNEFPRIGDYNDVRRIAYLVANPPKDEIHIDINSFGSICFEDGCHRLGAAIYLKAAFIKLGYSGYINEFEKKFPDRRIVRSKDRNKPTWTL